MQLDISDFFSIANTVVAAIGAVVIVIQIRQQTRKFLKDNEKIHKDNEKFHKDNERIKIQSTIEFFNRITYENQDLLDCIYDKPLNSASVKADNDLEKKVMKYLFSLEQLAVGVEEKIYDFDILKKMVSRYLYRIYKHLINYIEEIRTVENSPNRYRKFENLAKELFIKVSKEQQQEPLVAYTNVSEKLITDHSQ